MNSSAEKKHKERARKTLLRTCSSVSHSPKSAGARQPRCSAALKGEPHCQKLSACSGTAHVSAARATAGGRCGHCCLHAARSFDLSMQLAAARFHNRLRLGLQPAPHGSHAGRFSHGGPGCGRRRRRHGLHDERVGEALRQHGHHAPQQRVEAAGVRGGGGGGHALEVLQGIQRARLAQLRRVVVLRQLQRKRRKELQGLAS